MPVYFNFKNYIPNLGDCKTRENLFDKFLSTDILALEGGKWFLLLNLKNENDKFEFLLYATAMNMPLNQYQEILIALGSEIIVSYLGKNPSLISAAAMSGTKDNLNALLEKYRFTEAVSVNTFNVELKKSIFFAAYYGNKEVFNYLKDKLSLSLDSFKDEDNNTLLHVAVMGNQPDMIQHILSHMGLEGIKLKNKANYTALELAVLAGSEILVSKIAHKLELYHDAVDYNALVRLLASQSTLSDIQKKIFPYLCEPKNQRVTQDSINQWISDAIVSKNDSIVEEIFIHLWFSNDLVFNNLITTADTAQCHNIATVLRSEAHFKGWVETLKKYLVEKLSAYIDRSEQQLIDLAREDDVTQYYDSNASDDQREERKLFCGTNVVNLFSEREHYLKRVYLNIIEKDANILDYFTREIHLKRNELIECVKENNRGKPEYQKLFKQKIGDAIVAAYAVLNLKVIAIVPSDNTNNNQQAHNRNEKKEHFIEQFAEEFDKTYRFYICLSGGELIQPADNVDRLADMAKKAAGILPNLKISPAALGIPIPLSFDFPSSAAAAAVIDICLFMRDKNQQNRATRVQNFFSGTTLRDRTDRIYHCATSIAEQFQTQIEILNISEIPYLAALSIARLFKYMVESDNNTQIEAPSLIGSLFRKLSSYIVNVRAEPEAIQMALARVANEAIPVKENLVMYRNQSELCKLLLASEYRDPLGKDPDKQWTAKGIFEHTGICFTENNRMVYYAEDGQNVGKYGYTLGTKEEALHRRMQPVNFQETPEKKPWFERDARDNALIAQRQQAAAAVVQNPPFHTVFFTQARNAAGNMAAIVAAILPTNNQTNNNAHK